MKRKIIIAGLGIAVLLGWIVIGQMGCEWTPGRDNPLDPNSNLFNPVLTGEVTNLANVPVSQAMVTLQPEGTVAVTGNDGVYRFEGVDLGEYTLTVQKTDHVGDTVNVNIASGSTTTQDFQINALPQFDSVSVSSHYIHLIPNYIYVTIEAWIVNEDSNPIEDSVLAVFEDDTLGYLDKIQTVGNYGVYSYDFDTDTAFPGINYYSLELIIGKTFILIAFDSQGGVSVSEPQQLVRFLEPSIINYPTGSEIVSQTPTLGWTLYEGEFEFFQNARVFNDNRNLIWDSLGIAPEITQVTVTDSLPVTILPGPLHYYWTLEIVDLFGNTSTSEELQFRVE